MIVSTRPKSYLGPFFAKAQLLRATHLLNNDPDQSPKVYKNCAGRHPTQTLAAPFSLRSSPLSPTSNPPSPSSVAPSRGRSATASAITPAQPLVHPLRHHARSRLPPFPTSSPQIHPPAPFPSDPCAASSSHPRVAPIWLDAPPPCKPPPPYCTPSRPLSRIEVTLR